MSDPLTDPRAKDLLAADPTEVSTLANQFRQVSTQAETAMHGLQGAHNAANWTGDAADRFREKLGKLPGDLQKVAQSYGDAATALSAYGMQLEPLKSQFQALVPQIQHAQTAATNAQTGLSTAKGNYSTAKSAKGAKPTDPSVTNANRAVTNANGALSTAQGNVTGLDGRASHILDEFDTLRGHARSAMSKAAGLAPQDNSSWFSSMCSAVGNFMKGAGKFIANAAVSVWHAAERLPGDFTYLATHLDDLKAWSKFAGDLGTVAGAVALVAAVIVCPLDAIGFEGAAAAFATTDSVAGAVALGATADKTVFDSSLAIEGKGSWGEVGFDAVSLAMSGAKVPGLKGAQGTASDLEGTAGALEQYAAGRGSGLTATQAYSALTDTQRSLLRTSTVSLTHNQGLTTLISATKTAAARATKVEHLFDAGNELVHGGADHAHELVHDKLLPEPPAGEPAAAGASQGG